MKKISEHTCSILFDIQLSDNSRVDKEEENTHMNDFVEDFGQLDLFLAECLTPTENDGSNPRNKESEPLAYSQAEGQALIKQWLSPNHGRTRVSAKDNEREAKRQKRKFDHGTIIADRYVIKEYLAKGGFGEVYKGYHKQLGIDIAIKVLKNDKAFDQEIKERFFREAKIMATINHPNVVRIYDTGEYQGRIYLIMDYIDGLDLEAFVKNKKELSSTEHLSLMAQITDALAAIHNQSIIHRDVKPGNIIVTKAGKPILMDFGLAKEPLLNRDHQDQLTVQGMCLGTPLYMAPEQFRNPSQVTKASDVYSLGVTFYQMVTGTHPFPGETFFEVYEKHKTMTPKPAHILFPNIDPEIGRIIDKMLQKDQSKRYADGPAVKEALRRIKLKKISNFTNIAVMILIFGVMGGSAWGIWNLFRPSPVPVIEKEPTRYADQWASQPRIFSVIPFGVDASSNSYFSDLITNFLAQSDHDIVEREKINLAIEELNLNQTEFTAPETAVKIGKLAGAHIIITGNISAYKGIDQVNVRAFNVETSEILGSATINSETPEIAIKTLVRRINRRLVYRSFIIALNDDKIELKHGKLHGAFSGMKTRVLNENGDIIGVLEVKDSERDKAFAKILMENGHFKRGMKVEEVKEEIHHQEMK